MFANFGEFVKCIKLEISISCDSVHLSEIIVNYSVAFRISLLKLYAIKCRNQ